MVEATKPHGQGSGAVVEEAGPEEVLKKLVILVWAEPGGREGDGEAF